MLLKALGDFAISSLVYESEYLSVYRGERRRDQLAVFLKVLKSAFPSPAERTWFKNDYEITRDLKVDGVLRPLELLQVDNSLALVQEGAAGEPLRAIMNRGRLPLATVLRIGTRIATAVAEIHRAGIVQRNLSPETILCDLAHEQIRITDFRLSSILAQEYPENVTAPLFGADLRYIAPEQTGRVNFPIDCRCDLYAIGVILHELLTGSVPFVGDDPMALIYGHLATPPTLPNDLPRPVRDLVLKLLAKNPEDRYQSGRGLVGDLERILQTPEGPSRFPLGRDDAPGQLVFHRKLYGREQETAAILESFATAAGGGRELVVVTGYSGIGKTSLVREIYLPITRSRGYFAQGKFDQVRKNVPMSALVAAFRSLTRQILTEPENRVLLWKDRIIAALGPNGRLMTDIIPELQHLIGEQPDPEVLPPQEARQRFNRVLLSFIRVFCSEDHPLALFLDDLQWADSASLDFLAALLAEDVRYLLVIGAYRDNEVNRTHPLMQTLEQMRRMHLPMREINLPPLRRAHVTQFLADILHQAESRVHSLADLLVRKTNGNPFFLIQFLKKMVEDHLLEFDPQQARWQWDLPRITARDITENVVELMLERLRRLPPATREALRSAACLGNRFDLRTLALVTEQPLRQAFRDLVPAVQEGLVLNTSGFETIGEDLLEADLVIMHFRYLHDRVQQAAYGLIAKGEAPARHLQIGRRLQPALSPGGSREHLFAVADHLNLGRQLIVDPEERIHLAQINLEAARLARESTAYQAGLSYLQAGMEQLPESLWDNHYGLALELYRERAELEYLNGHFEEAERLINQAMENARSPLEKAETLYRLIVQRTLQARYPEAIDLARRGLALLGIDLPETDYESARDRQMALVDNQLAGRNIESLVDLPPMRDPGKKVAMRILTAMGPPCYRNHPRLWSVIVPMEMNLVLEYGDVPAATYTYTSYGGLLGFVRGEYGDCAAFSRLAEGLAGKYHSSSDLSVAHLMTGASLDHWFRHLRHAEESYQKAYQVGVESGNLQYSVYAFGHRMYCRFFRGMPLPEQAEDLPEYLAFSRSRKNQWGIDLKLGILLVLNNLTGRSKDSLEFSSEEEREAAYLERCERQGNIQVLCVYHLLKAYALYLHGHHAEAGQAIDEARARLLSVSPQGLLPSAEFYFTEALIKAAACTPAENQTSLSETRDHLALWARHSPDNFLHKQLLIDAEIAAIQGRRFEAADLFDRAAEEAGRQGFIQHQAVAWERAARFWLGNGKEEFAVLYLKKARYGFDLWGARRKVDRLDREFSRYLQADSGTVEPAPGRPENLFPNLDLMAVVKASQAISGQFRRQDLFTTLMEIVQETAGAENAFLIQPDRDKLLVVAHIDLRRKTQLLPEPEQIESCPEIFPAIIQYVARTRETIALDDAGQSEIFRHDPRLRERRLLSVLCLPILSRGQLQGIFYLENNRIRSAFNSEQLEVLQVLSAQAAISLENARFYSQLEERVEERTRALAETNQRLKVTLDELARSNADLEQFAYVASHDLQEPLRMISSYLQLLERRYGNSLDSDAHDFIGFAVDGAKRMQSLINDLLTYSRVGRKGKAFASVNLGEALSQALANLQVAIADAGALVTHDRLPEVRADHGQMVQLFQNLLHNAVKFRGEKPPLIHVSAKLKNAAEYTISVQDNGIGFESRFSERIFIIFQRLHGRDDYPGTGIGLALCKRIVEHHGGRIWVQSHPGEGTTFYFTLPVTETISDAAEEMILAAGEKR